MKLARGAIIRFGLRAVTSSFFFVAAAILIGLFARTWDWPSALGQVEQVAIVPSGDPDDSRAPGDQQEIEVVVSYEVAGESLSTTQLAPVRWIFRNTARARSFAERYGLQPGSRVPVYFNAEEPGEAVIVRDILWRRVEPIAALIFLVLLPTAVLGFSFVDLVRGGGSRSDDDSRGRYW